MVLILDGSLTIVLPDIDYQYIRHRLADVANINPYKEYLE